jgi:NAD(P)-dependent dehydrogenase (short-subunit alcohol dehydrogenase family)
VSPGTVSSPGYKNSLGLTDEQIKQFSDGAAGSPPLGRVGELDEVAKAVVFLASDDRSYINAIELFVDGGQAKI